MAKKRMKKKGARRTMVGSNPSYSGPIRTLSEIDAKQVVEAVLGETGSFVSSVSGTLNDVFPNNPNLCNDWSNWAANFKEYRVLGMEVHTIPANRGFLGTNGTTQLQGAMITVKDRISSTALTSYAVAMNFPSSKLFHTTDKTSTSMKAAGTEEMTWITTSTPVANYWIKLFGTGLTISSVYGNYFIYYRVQFRNNS